MTSKGASGEPVSRLRPRHGQGCARRLATIRPLSAATRHGGRWAQGRGWARGDARHEAATRSQELRHGQGHAHYTAVAACDTARARGQRGACAHRLGQVGALSTWLSSDSVFGPVLTQNCSRVNFWTLLVSPVHEHCSSQKFSNFF